MFCYGKTSPFSGGRVRVGRDEVFSNESPRGMAIAFGSPKSTEPGLQASWCFLLGSKLHPEVKIIGHV